MLRGLEFVHLFAASQVEEIELPFADGSFDDVSDEATSTAGATQETTETLDSLVTEIAARIYEKEDRIQLDYADLPKVKEGPLGLPPT